MCLFRGWVGQININKIQLRWAITSMNWSGLAGPKKASLTVIVHHGIRREGREAQFYIRACQHCPIETREQLNDATDHNGLKYKLPDIVVALISHLDAFHLSRLILLNVSLSLVLDTLLMISCPPSIENFSGVFFFNQRPLCFENSKLSWMSQFGFLAVEVLTELNVVVQ